MIFGCDSRLLKEEIPQHIQVYALQKNRPVPAFFFPTFLRTAVIDKPVPAFFENAGIGNPITAAQNQRFKKRCNRRPITAFLKNAGIGGPKALG